MKTTRTTVELEVVALDNSKRMKMILEDKMQRQEISSTKVESESRPNAYDREARESFASFREDRSTIQGFQSSKLSSYARQADEEAIGSEESSDDDSIEIRHKSRFQPPKTQFVPPLTNPLSVLHGLVAPCEGFHGWKGIAVKGKLASRSFGDLRLANKEFSWESDSTPTTLNNASGRSPIERLPAEILGAVIDQLLLDVPPTDFQPRNGDLVSLLLTSHCLHSATLATLYKNITIPHSRVFRKFLARVTKHPSLGTMVRRLDFSHFNPTGAGISASERAKTMNLTKDTLLQCLDTLPNLQEFLAQEHIDGDISADVIRKLLSMPRLKALDFCGSHGSTFRDALTDVFSTSQTIDLPNTLNITRLSLHECAIAPASVFTTLLPKLLHLTHLDVAHTRITASALDSIPSTARLTHLNLSRCTHMTGNEVVDFLTTHPSTKTLVYLNLMTDAKSHEMLDENDISALLPRLPRTLRSLNLKGSSMCTEHLPLLSPLTKQLEELGLGGGVSYDMIAKLLLPPTPEMLPASSTGPDYAAMVDAREAWTPHALKYIDMSDLEAREIDMSTFLHKNMSLVRNRTAALDVIELSESMASAMQQRTTVLRGFGWVVKGEGRRGWLVRDVSIGLKMVYSGLRLNHFTLERPDAVGINETVDDGVRDWKMGGRWWGMRKVPVARQDVGGMYGLYMFKR